MSLTDPGIEQLAVLSPEQEAQFAAVCDEWSRIGLATGPADHPAAEDGVRQAYRATGLPPPRQMIWLGSPLAGSIAAAILEYSDLSDRTPDEYWLTVRPQLRRQLQRMWSQPPLEPPQAGDALTTGRFGAAVGKALRGRITEPVRHAVIDEFHRRLRPPTRETETAANDGAPLWAGELEPRLNDQVRQATRRARDLGWWIYTLAERTVEPVLLPFLADDAEDAVEWDPDWDMPSALQGVCGQHDSEWLALGAALRKLIRGAANIPGLDGLMRIARSAGWWWPFEHLVILTERPTSLHFDEQGAVHNADGPAIAYPDGLKVWAWHGRRVPRHVIEEPGLITPQQIRHESNAEIRHIMLERYGLGRYLRTSGAGRVSSDDTGILWRTDFGGGPPLLMVEVRNSTPEPDGSHKHYWLRVPPETRTAREAVAWTFGLAADGYRPIIET